VDEDAFNETILEHESCETLHMTVIRLGVVKEIPVTLMASPYPAYKLKPVENPTNQQHAIYNSWMGIK
jgi:hypothetical protein